MSNLSSVRSAAAAQGQPEVCGIIISRGSREEVTPRFSAYIWGPIPTDEAEAASKAA